MPPPPHWHAATAAEGSAVALVEASGGSPSGGTAGPGAGATGWSGSG
jgi:hypothetical protein